MALRVVSLPATTSRMKNEASSALVSCSPSMFAVASAVIRSSFGSWSRAAHSSVTRPASSAPAVRIWPTASSGFSLMMSGSLPDRITFVSCRTMA